MGFAATAEVGEFDEAIGWFRNQLPVTTSKLADMSEAERQRAFFITGVAQLDVVADVHRSILEAIKKGTSLDDWRKEISATLTEAWGRQNSPRIETIYRNATQRAYVAGRMEQLRDPMVKRLRPFLKYIAIMDMAPCPGNICKACNGTVLPVDDPWWLTHQPQLHHRCRCRIDSLRRETAEDEGITSKPPEDMPPEGWGASTELQSLEEFKKPILKRIRETIDAELVEEFDRKQKSPPRPRKTPKANPDHDPKRWEPYFEKKYGKAAPTVAWGRAMVERGLDMTVGEARAEVERLRNAGVKAVPTGLYLGTDNKAKLRNVSFPSDENNSERDHVAALVAHAKGIKPAGKLSVPALEVSARNAPPKAQAIADAALSFYGHLSDASLEHPTSLGFSCVGKERAGFYSNTGQIEWSERFGDLPHEWAHALEFLNEKLGERATEFLYKRIAGHPEKSMPEWEPKKHYGSDERAVKDNFPNAYVGKVPSVRGAWTEVSSMAAQYISGGKGAWLMREDPELYWFLLGQLANR